MKALLLDIIWTANMSSLKKKKCKNFFIGYPNIAGHIKGMYHFIILQASWECFEKSSNVLRMRIYGL